MADIVCTSDPAVGWKDVDYAFMIGAKPRGPGMERADLLKDNGKIFVGGFKDGNHHGQGTYTWTNGQKYEGEFKNGKKWNGTVYNNDGIKKSKYVNGVKP